MCWVKEGLGRERNESRALWISAPLLSSSPSLAPHLACIEWPTLLLSLPSSSSSVSSPFPLPARSKQNRAGRWSSELTCRLLSCPHHASCIALALLYCIHAPPSTPSRRACPPPPPPSAPRPRSTPRAQPRSVGDGGTGKTTFVKRVRPSTLFLALSLPTLTLLLSFDST